MQHKAQHRCKKTTLSMHLQTFSLFTFQIKIYIFQIVKKNTAQNINFLMMIWPTKHVGIIDNVVHQV
ncbi:hypothetical protein CBR65_16140 [Cellvibrio sp. PSBB006]|nr:hypothetical protein CBR65_16140 [Cellvibrio sp. PSBB006]